MKPHPKVGKKKEDIKVHTLYIPTKKSLQIYCMHQITENFIKVRIQHVTLKKILKDDKILIYHTHFITYVDIKSVN